MNFADVLKVINRFKREERFSLAVLCLESTFHDKGARAAMRHAKQISAAFNTVRAHRMAERTEALRRQAAREGLRYV